MATYGPVMSRIGSALRPKSAIGAHNFDRDYYAHIGASGDVRVKYIDLNFNSTGSGEVLRVRGIANATGVAAGGTVNAIHATGRVASGKTVSGALNAIRATLEVAGTTPTPGGTLSALQLDSNLSATTTLSGQSAFIRITDSGSDTLDVFANFPDSTAHDSGGILVETAAYAATDLVRAVKCVDSGGETFWLVGTTTAPKA